MTEHFPKLMKNVNPHIQEAQQTPSRKNTKKITLRYILDKLMKHHKEKTLKTIRFRNKLLKNNKLNFHFAVHKKWLHTSCAHTQNAKQNTRQRLQTLKKKYINLDPYPEYMSFKNKGEGTSLMVQSLRIHMPMQGTRVPSLVQEDPTCCGATKPMCYNYWACALEPVSHNYWAHVPQLLKPTLLELVLRDSCWSHRSEKTKHRNEE